MQPSRPRFTGTLPVCLALVFTGTLGAQTTSDPAPKKEDEVVTLSPFEVNAADDRGYIATNTLAGGRLNTSLADTPASISVMTEEFLADIGATNVMQAIEYGLNVGNDIGGGGTAVGASTGNGLTGNEFNFQIRGYRNAAQTRDYFPTTIAADAFNIERIEVARGPNSLIFGVGGPGGIVNTAPKGAVLNRDFVDVTLRVGSWNEFRSSLDVNQSLAGGKFALRVNGLYQEKDGWKDFARDDQRRGALALAYQPITGTKLKFNAEAGSLEQNRVRPWNAVDSIARWVSQGSFYVPFGTPEQPWLAGDSRYTQQVPSAGTGLPDNGLPPNVPPGEPYERRTAHIGTPTVFLTDGPLAGKLLWIGSRNEGKRYYRTSYNDLVAGFNTSSFIEDEDLFPRSGNAAGSGAVNYNDYSVLSATLEQRIGKNLDLQFIAARSEADRRNNSPVGFNSLGYTLDVTSTLPTFTTTGAYDGTFVTNAAGANATGKGIGTLTLNQAVPNPYVGTPIVTYTPSYSLIDQLQEDARVSANYHLDLGKAGDHNVLGFVSTSRTSSENQSFQETNVSPTRRNPNLWFDAQNFGGRSTHIDYFASSLSERGVPDPFTNPLPSGHYYGENVAYGFQDGFIRNGWSAAKTTIDSYAVALQSYFFDRSLVTTIGGRRDEVSIVNRARIVDSRGEATGLADPSAAQEEKGDTYSIGAVYHLPFLKGVSVFANKSTNFQPQGGAQRFEDAAVRPEMEIGALKGTGQDYGLKFNLFDGRAYATVSYYEVAQANAASGYDANFTNHIEAIWTTIRNGGPNTVVRDRDAPDGHLAGGSETRDQSSEGWEFELTANPTPNWRVTFNISKAENVVANLGNNLGAYFEKHRAEWTQAANLAYDTGLPPGFQGTDTNFTVSDLLTNLDNLLTILKAGEGVAEVNGRPLTANLFTAYDFRQGAFKGLTIGGGVNYRGDQVMGVNPVTATNPTLQVFKGGEYILGNAMIAYEFPIRKTKVQLQLNVDNVFGNDDRQVLASNYNAAVGRLETFYYYLDPRRYSLSARISF